MLAPVTLGVVEECIPALRPYAAVLLRNPQDQDDLVHDCLVRALDRLSQIVVVRDHAQSIREPTTEKEIRRRGDAYRYGADERYRITADQERFVEIRDVFQALKCLPEEQRSVLVLISVEDLPYAEAAQVLEIPVGTVMSRLPSKTLHRGNRGSDHLSPHSGTRELRPVEPFPEISSQWPWSSSDAEAPHRLRPSARRRHTGATTRAVMFIRYAWRARVILVQLKSAVAGVAVRTVIAAVVAI